MWGRNDNERLWTPDETTTLIENWATKSGSQLAALLNRTRNSIAGKTKRLQENGTLPSLIVKQYENQPRQSRPRPPPRPKIVELKPLNKIVRETAPAPAPARFNGSKPCTLFDLTDARCHWPIGDPKQPDFHFCGAAKIPEPSVPYCDHHVRIAYNKPGGAP